MNNEGTKKQIKDWLDRAYKMARNPDPLEEARIALREKRIKRKSIIKGRYGL